MQSTAVVNSGTAVRVVSQPVILRNLPQAGARAASSVFCNYSIDCVSGVEIVRCLPGSSSTSCLIKVWSRDGLRYVMGEKAPLPLVAHAYSEVTPTSRRASAQLDEVELSTGSHSIHTEPYRLGTTGQAALRRHAPVRPIGLQAHGTIAHRSSSRGGSFHGCREGGLGLLIEYQFYGCVTAR